MHDLNTWQPQNHLDSNHHYPSPHHHHPPHPDQSFTPHSAQDFGSLYTSNHDGGNVFGETYYNDTDHDGIGAWVQHT
jgi:hypothetical protein